MYSSHLRAIAPPLHRVAGRLPLSRDQLMLLMAAVGEIFMAVDIYMAHQIRGGISRNEWIPIIFGLSAGVALLVAGLVALRKRPLATVLANVIFLLSIVVGVAGVYFHLGRANLLDRPFGLEAVALLIWAPPFLGPMFFALFGVLGISAAWVEDPPDSGRLRLLGKTQVQMPYSKTRAYFFLVALGTLATVISSSLDHARLNFNNSWVWLPLMAGIFGAVTAALLGAIKQPTPGDLMVYTVAMLWLLVTGLVGLALHIDTNLIAENTVIAERFIRGSPLLAPLLFANMGLLGLLVLLDPVEGRRDEDNG